MTYRYDFSLCLIDVYIVFICEMILGVEFSLNTQIKSPKSLTLVVSVSQYVLLPWKSWIDT